MNFSHGCLILLSAPGSGSAKLNANIQVEQSAADHPTSANQFIVSRRHCRMRFAGIRSPPGNLMGRVISDARCRQHGGVEAQRLCREN